MTTEIIILRVPLPDVFDPFTIHHICQVGYRATGNKFSIKFHGSKGYLSHLEIDCEGWQRANNRIFKIFNKDGSVKKKLLNIYYSDYGGIRLSLGADKARVVLKNKPVAPTRTENRDEDDLPF